MARPKCAGAALVVAAVLATPALGAESAHLAGAIEGAGTVTETVTVMRKGERRYRAFKFVFRGIPLTCEDGTRTTYRVRDRHLLPFASPPRLNYASGGAVQTIGSGPYPYIEWAIDGFARGRQGASGTIRVRGTDMVIGETTHAECRSGGLAWETKPVTR